MITVHAELRIEDTEATAGYRSVDYVRHYERLPWPRLPVTGDIIYLNAPDVYTETDVPVHRVIFHPNGNIVVELEPYLGIQDDLDSVQELVDLGFSVGDPYVKFAQDPPRVRQL